jgi:hypothetical protein
MPIISKDQIDFINALFNDAQKAARAIRAKAPHCAEECDAIDQAGHAGFDLLHQIRQAEDMVNERGL